MRADGERYCCPLFTEEPQTTCPPQRVKSRSLSSDRDPPHGGRRGSGFDLRRKFASSSMWPSSAAESSPVVTLVPGEAVDQKDRLPQPGGVEERVPFLEPPGHPCGAKFRFATMLGDAPHGLGDIFHPSDQPLDLIRRQRREPLSQPFVARDLPFRPPLLKDGADPVMICLPACGNSEAAQEHRRPSSDLRKMPLIGIQCFTKPFSGDRPTLGASCVKMRHQIG